MTSGDFCGATLAHLYPYFWDFSALILISAQILGTPYYFPLENIQYPVGGPMARILRLVHVHMHVYVHIARQTEFRRCIQYRMS